MKKLLSVLLLLALLLTACATLPEPEASSVPASSSASEPSESTGTTLMELRQSVGTEGNVWYFPIEAVEKIKNPEMCLFGEDSLLIYGVDYENGNLLSLCRVSLLDGSVLAEGEMFVGGMVTVQAADGRVGVCDIMKQSVVLLDGDLRQTASHSVALGGDCWYLSCDLSALYILDWQSGMTRTELESGQTTAVLADVTNAFLRTKTGDSLAVGYQKNGKQWCGVLDLRTGELSDLPCGGDATNVAHTGDAWLLSDSTQWDAYRLISGGQTTFFLFDGSRIDLPAPQNRLLTGSLNADTLNLYDLEGNFLSRAVLGENAYTAATPLWSERYGGYFLLCFDGKLEAKLYFWDVQAPVSGENFVFDKGLPEEHGGVSADADLYARAEALSQAHDVKICIADQCEFENDYYTFYEVNDRETVSDALDLLSTVLDYYPDGFFRQLCSGRSQQLRIELVGGIAPKDGAGVGSTAAAFTQKFSTYTRIVADVYSCGESAICHELSHAIDAYLQYNASMRTDALFSEEGWAALNPPGFDYAYSYESDLSEQHRTCGTGYFHSEYGMTYPTEDRATIMEAAMTQAMVDLSYWQGVLTKLDYYSRCIRDAFDTTGWPQTTRWETYLH